MVGILASHSPENHTREIFTDFHDEIRNLSVSEQENGAQTLKKHSNVLVLEVGSLPTYTVATVRVLPFFRINIQSL